MQSNARLLWKDWTKYKYRFDVFLFDIDLVRRRRSTGVGRFGLDWVVCSCWPASMPNASITPKTKRNGARPDVMDRLLSAFESARLRTIAVGPPLRGEALVAAICNSCPQPRRPRDRRIAAVPTVGHRHRRTEPPLN
ncbi:unnamed protein product [Angiostrongylus costaricensis]|uniref:Transposase n=1 Tax=Angiostrongylus costaricensis TaxID=334426 RepID=A0A0R3PY32_ANGCS|nr:unnamed protein product [Angiostrongylus costaricensis]